jgi:hypothetical protein
MYMIFFFWRYFFFFTFFFFHILAAYGLRSAAILSAFDLFFFLNGVQSSIHLFYGWFLLGVFCLGLGSGVEVSIHITCLLFGISDISVTGEQDGRWKLGRVFCTGKWIFGCL